MNIIYKVIYVYIEIKEMINPKIKRSIYSEGQILNFY